MAVRDQPMTLWRLRKDGKWIECVARLVPTGVEVEIVSMGTALCSRIFPTGDEALACAKEERRLRKI
jgi:hypothetical protein